MDIMATSNSFLKCNQLCSYTCPLTSVDFNLEYFRQVRTKNHIDI